MSADDFYLAKNARKIRSRLQETINCESPIAPGLAYRRVLRSFGQNRLTPRLRQYLWQLLGQCEVLQVHHGERTFLWRIDQNPQHEMSWRTAVSDEERRQADELPPEEIAALAKELLRQQVGLPRADLARLCARNLGFSQLSGALEKVVQEGINLAIARSWIRPGNNGHDNLTTL